MKTGVLFWKTRGANFQETQFAPQISAIGTHAEEESLKAESYVCKQVYL